MPAAARLTGGCVGVPSPVLPYPEPQARVRLAQPFFGLRQEGLLPSPLRTKNLVNFQVRCRQSTYCALWRHAMERRQASGTPNRNRINLLCSFDQKDLEGWIPELLQHPMCTVLPLGLTFREVVSRTQNRTDVNQRYLIS
jgi:hypothetical protein